MSSKNYILLSVFILLLPLIFISGVKEEDISANQKISTETSHQSVTIPDTLTFAGEKVPLKDFDIKERLDKELLSVAFFHSQTIHYIKLANRWFPEIEKILAEEGLPDDFKYMVVTESGMQDVVSPMHAAGFWQFLPATAKEYGLEVSNEVDERYHLEKATRAACKYLRKTNERLGTWTLAAASYNCGYQRMKNILESQKVESYYDLYLNTETARYLFRMLAYKLVMSNPQQYGFNIKQEDLYEPLAYKTITIDTPIHDLPTFALEHNTNYKVLKLLNPWLIKPNLNNISGKTYEIRLPL